MISSLRLVASGLLLASVSACSIWPAAAPDEALATSSEQQRQALVSWQLKARVRTQDERANLRWKQQADSFNLLLRGPFGLGGVRISGTPQQIEIDDGETRQVSHFPQRDIYQRTGLIVPVASLPYWLRGLPAPDGKFVQQRDELGNVSLIEQQGWSITLSDYQRVDGILFPHHIELAQAPWFLALDVTRWSWP